MIRAALNSGRIGGHLVLDAALLETSGASARVCMSRFSNADLSADEAIERRSVGGAARLDGPAAALAAFRPTAPEVSHLAGRDCLVGLRNTEPAAIVAEWITFHVRHHGATGALIFDRAAPGNDRETFAAELAAALAPIEADGCRVVLATADLPLGAPEGLPERHLLNAPDAPGKDRMTAPAADPWSAPLAEPLIYEALRQRFLGAAAAVANLDPSDLALPPGEGAPGLFATAHQSTGGVLTLSGRRVYPWRIPAETAGFGDHVCVSFDRPGTNRRWCIVPAAAGEAAIWRPNRIGGVLDRSPPSFGFLRCMALRHPGAAPAELAPKTSLVRDAAAIAVARDVLGAAPDLPPEPAPPAYPAAARDGGRTLIVTTMKNEGPFILDWLAHHRAIGVDDVLVYTNDCTDGTDRLLDLLAARGLVHHRDNPFREMGLRPQHAAFQAAEAEPVLAEAGWILCMDVDEYIDIHVGEGRLEDLFEAVGEANMIALTWRLFGNGDIDAFADRPVTEQFRRCAPRFIRKPHQAWGFKTLFRNLGFYRKLGVHRPKGLRPELRAQIRWVNGSGHPMPEGLLRNGWRSTPDSVGYDLVTLNHYAVRSAESFLVKRDRGRVNHVDRDQGLAYWFRMNNNAETDSSILRHAARTAAEKARLLSDPELAAAHAACVAAHRDRIATLRADPAQAAFHATLVSPRMRRLSRMHAHFGANVFLAGPEVVPDTVVFDDDLAPDFFFTVPRQEAAH